MNCPKCHGSHTMSATKKESVRVHWMVAGRDYAKSEKDSETVTHRCLDCAHEWEGRDE